MAARLKRAGLSQVSLDQIFKLCFQSVMLNDTKFPGSEALAEAKDAVGGGSKLAKALGDISPQAVTQWRNVPAARVLDVERVSGVPRHRLRPDLYPLDSVPSSRRPSKRVAVAPKEFCEWKPYRFFPWVEWRVWQAVGETGAPLGIYGIQRRWRRRPKVVA